MKRSIYILSLVLFIVPLSLSAQFKKYNKEQKKAFLEGESFFQYGDYLSAAQLFESLEEASEEFPELHYLLGTAYFNLKRYDESMEHLEKGADFNKNALYRMAKVYLHERDLRKARSTLLQYDTLWPALKEPKYSREDIDYLMGKIMTAAELLRNPDVVNIINLGPSINTKDAEYGPLISSDETILVYTSRRLTDENGMDPTGQPFEDIYYSERNDRGEWTEGKRMPGKVNTAKHDAAVGLSSAGDRLFIYRSHENLVGGDIYESDYENGSWSVPVLMPTQINNMQTIEPSASLSLDGNTFYFSSNREGGYGGFDIYRVVKLPTGDWSLPINLGPTVNTKYNDDGPFIHPDGKTLYFTSEGHKNMGGYDIFKTVWEDSVWTEPENLGSPTNTTKDDVYFVIAANEQHAYYSSDKEGGFGDQDLYKIDYLEKSLRSSVIRGKVVDKDGNPLRADISLVEIESGELSGVYVSDQKDGDFIFLVNPNVLYEILIEHPDYPEFYEDVEYKVDDLLEPQNRKFVLE